MTDFTLPPGVEVPEVEAYKEHREHQSQMFTADNTSLAYHLISHADAAIDELQTRVAELEFIVGEMPTYFVEEARRRWLAAHPDAEEGA